MLHKSSWIVVLLGAIAAPAWGQSYSPPKVRAEDAALARAKQDAKESVTGAFSMPVAWGLIASLGAAVAMVIRLYRRVATPSNPTAAVANDAWVQARLRGEITPAPLPDIVPATGLFAADSASPLGSAPLSKPWHRPIRAQNAE